MRPLLAGIIALTVCVALLAWVFGIVLDRQELNISIHGYIALIAGATVTFALGAGLMALSYYSNKHGYDDLDGPNGPS